MAGRPGQVGSGATVVFHTVDDVLHQRDMWQVLSGIGVRRAVLQAAAGS